MSLDVNMFIKKDFLFVKLRGEMDQYTSDELRIKLNEIIVKYQISNVIFNLKNITFLDSSGIGIIIGRYNQVKNKGGKIYLVELNETIKKIVLLSGLNRICEIKESEETLKYTLLGA